MSLKELEDTSSKIAIFRGKQIRKAIYQEEWYFSIIDIVEVLTGSPNPRRYWSNLKIQLSENEGFAQLYSKMVQLKLLAPDGKMREIEKRMRGIAIREQLTNEWEKRGVREFID